MISLTCCKSFLCQSYHTISQEVINLTHIYIYIYFLIPKPNILVRMLEIYGSFYTRVPIWIFSK